MNLGSVSGASGAEDAGMVGGDATSVAWRAWMTGEVLVVCCASMSVRDGGGVIACRLEDARRASRAVCCDRRSLGLMHGCAWRVGTEGLKDVAVVVCGDECRRR